MSEEREFLEIVDCANAQEFFEYVNPTAERWSKHGTWIYRGHANADWKLEPAAWRKENSAKLISFLKEDEEHLEVNDHISRVPDLDREYIRTIAAEHEAVHKFASLADELGFPLLGYGRDDIGRSRGVLKGESTFYASEIKERPVFALAQHHGVPTEFLDWTYSSYIAAFFACEHIKQDAKYFAIWALLKEGDPRSNYPRNLEFYHCPTYNHNYLRFQNGVFTIMRRLKVMQFYKEHKYWPTLEDYLISFAWKNCSFRPQICLRKITAPVSERSKILTMLEKMRVTKTHLKPTLDNVGTAIWKED